MVLRGGSDAFIDEAERSLHDAIMIVRRARKNAQVVAGGGAIDMELSKWGPLLTFPLLDECEKLQWMAPPNDIIVLGVHAAIQILKALSSLRLQVS